MRKFSQREVGALLSTCGERSVGSDATIRNKCGLCMRNERICRLNGIRSPPLTPPRGRDPLVSEFPGWNFKFPHIDFIISPSPCKERHPLWNIKRRAHPTLQFGRVAYETNRSTLRWKYATCIFLPPGLISETIKQEGRGAINTGLPCDTWGWQPSAARKIAALSLRVRD